MGVTEKRLEKTGIGGRAPRMAGAGPTDLPYGTRGSPPPPPSLVAWALMSPAQVDPGSPLTIPSGNRRSKPEKKGDIRKEEWVPTWRTLSPFVKRNAQNDLIFEYPRKNRTKSRVAAGLKEQALPQTG